MQEESLSKMHDHALVARIAGLTLANHCVLCHTIKICHGNSGRFICTNARAKSMDQSQHDPSTALFSAAHRCHSYQSGVRITFGMNKNQAYNKVREVLPRLAGMVPLSSPPSKSLVHKCMEEGEISRGASTLLSGDIVVAISVAPYHNRDRN